MAIGRKTPLRDRSADGQEPRMARQTRPEQTVFTDVPTQGASPRMVAGAPASGHDKDRKYEEPATLFDDYTNRGLAVRDQDMTLEKTFSQLDAKLVVPGSLNAEQAAEWKKYYEPRNAEFEKANLTGKYLVVGATIATCTITWAVSKRWMKTSACTQVPGRQRPRRQHDSRVFLGPRVLSRRAWLVRQALDFRGIAPHPTARALAGCDQAGQCQRESRERS